MAIQDKSIVDLRCAASAWRRNDESANNARLGFLSFLRIPRNMSIHDRVWELVDEIERLRNERRD